jgi:hypothetical protein
VPLRFCIGPVLYWAMVLTELRTKVDVGRVEHCCVVAFLFLLLLEDEPEHLSPSWEEEEEDDWEEVRGREEGEKVAGQAL